MYRALFACRCFWLCHHFTLTLLLISSRKYSIFREQSLSGIDSRMWPAAMKHWRVLWHFATFASSQTSLKLNQRWTVALLCCPLPPGCSCACVFVGVCCLLLRTNQHAAALCYQKWLILSFAFCTILFYTCLRKKRCNYSASASHIVCCVSCGFLWLSVKAARFCCACRQQQIRHTSSRNQSIFRFEISLAWTCKTIWPSILIKVGHPPFAIIIIKPLQ